jgi:hypothetical protein
VFSCPTSEISDVQLLRAMTAAIKTKPWLFVAFDAVMCAPSGDQLCARAQHGKQRGGGRAPEPAEERAAGAILERLADLGLDFPVGRAPDLDGAVVGLRREVLADGVPTHALDEALVLVELANAF